MGFIGGSGKPKIQVDGVDVGTQSIIDLKAGDNIALSGVNNTIDGKIEITFDVTAITGSGSINTASNKGTGLGLFKTVNTDDLEFKSIVLGSNKLSGSSNTNDITLDIVESNISHQNLSGSGTNDHSDIDSHISDSSIHFTEASIDKYTRAEVDTLLSAKATTSSLTAHTANTSNPHSVTKSQVGLSNVENTALSTWAGSSNLTTLGTISSGSIPFSLVSGTVPITQGGTNATSARIAKQNLKTFNSNFISITSNTTLDSSHDGKFLRVDSSGGSVTITLPDSVTVGSGWGVTIQKATTSSNAVVVQSAGSDSIDGSSDLNLGRWEMVSIFNDGAGTFFDYNYNSYEFSTSVTSKGDLLVSKGINQGWTIASVGSNNSTLIADSSQSTGIKWGTLSIAGGGTGQTSANAAFNALAPSQTSNSGKFLTTDGSNTSWSSPLPSQSGNSGKYLTTNGTSASWGTVTTGALILLGSYTVSTPVAQVDFQNGVGGIVIDPATYITYLLVGRDILLSADNHLYFRFFQSGSIVASGTPYGYRTSSQDTGTSASTAAQIQMTRVGLDSATGKMSGFTGEIILGGSDMDYFVWKGIGYNTASGLEAYFGGGYLDTAGTTDGFRLTPASGNFVSGKFLLYGIKS